MASKETKGTNAPGQERAIFKIFSLGIVTARDDWVYAHSGKELKNQVSAFIDIYESERTRWRKEGRPKNVGAWVARSIKWTSELEHHLTNNDPLTFDVSRIRKVLYRPFVSYENYFDRIVTHRIYQNDQIFPISSQVENCTIAFLSVVSTWPLACLASDRLFDYCLLKQGNGATQSVSRWCFDGAGVRTDNITDWALVARFIQIDG